MRRDVKKGKRRNQIFSLVLGFLMIATILPLSVLTHAAGSIGDMMDPTPDVSVRWTPQQESVRSGEEAVIVLQASLRQEGTVTSADVKIALDEQEAEALQTFFGERSTFMTEQGVTLTLERQQAQGARLCFTLDGEHPAIRQSLLIKTPGGLTAPWAMDVTEEEIDIAPTVQQGVETQPVVDKQGGTLSITASFDWEAELQAHTQTLSQPAGSLDDFAFVWSAVSQNREQSGTLYTQRQAVTFTLRLPQGLTLPQGVYTYDGEQSGVLVGETLLARFSGLDANAQVHDIVRTDAQTLRFTVTRRAAAPVTEELSDVKYALVFTGAAILCAQDTASLQHASIDLQAEMTAVAAADETIVSTKTSQASIVFAAANAAEDETPDDVGQNAILATPTTVDRQVVIDRYREAFTHSIYWIDNYNEKDIRPDQNGYPRPKLTFSIDGAKPQELTEGNMGQIGLLALPQINLDTTAGVGVYRVSIGENKLPAQVTYIDAYGDATSHTVEWSVTPQDVQGYTLVDVADLSDYPSVSHIGWYYVLQTDVDLDMLLRWGTLGSAAGITDAIMNHFNLVVHTGRQTQTYRLSELRDMITGEYHPSEDPNNPTSGTLTIQNTWKYNLDGTMISYTVEEIDGGDGKIVLDTLEEGDYFAISYDNTNVPNFGSVTDKVHNGGTLIFTLTGRKDYQATKVWLDDGAPQTVAQRPTGEFQLWRYRRGESYVTASPVWGTDGKIVTVPLDTQHNSQTISFADLEKYDREGFEYFYVLREYLETTTQTGESAEQYEQVFGRVSEDGVVTDRIDQNGELVDTTDARPARDTHLYNGGVLSNRIEANVSVPVQKTWNAAAFQSAFDGVRIELTLQRRVAGSNDAWENTSIMETMDHFYAENLSRSVERNAPLYDALGRKLEYRWVESGVYQGESANLLTPDETGGVFTLKQDGRDVQYRSISVWEQDGSTQITNSIANTIVYDVQKVWHDAAGQPIPAPQGAQVVLRLYRTISGEGLGEPVAQFTLDGVVDAERTLVNEQLGIYVQETSAWTARVEPLAEFDEQGRQYEYILLETDGPAAYIPTYTTTRDEQGYHTVINNAPGEGNRIMVRKDWIDNSDIAHRFPVTITVYNRHTNEVVNTTTLGNGVWHNWVGIGTLEAEDVYILETKVGETDVPLTTYYIGQEEAPNYTQPQAPDEYTGLDDERYTSIQYQTAYHRYEASYSQEDVDTLHFYVVSNRRLGNVNLSVTKKWVDGTGQVRRELQQELERLEREEGKTLHLALRLNFADERAPAYFDISRTGVDHPDTVTVGNPDNRVAIVDSSGTPVSSDQALDLTYAESVYEFFNLPKYDRNGGVVNYDVEEIWMDETGAPVRRDVLQTEYPTIYALANSYRAVEQNVSYDTEDHFTADQFVKEIENRLTGTKSVHWYKQWEDQYNYLTGQRPDIYLDIYRVVHTADDPASTESELYWANYKWTYTADGDKASSEYFWNAELSGLPAYDDYGFEIQYYAVEHTMVNAQAFDYLPVQYAIPSASGDEPIPIGTEYALADEQYHPYVLNIQPQEGQKPHYALIENGTFTNTIYQELSLKGQKLWAPLPAQYPALDLPVVTFALDRSLPDGTKEENVASLTVTDWASIYENGSYIFRIEYEGHNTMDIDADGHVIVTGEPDAARLPKYDSIGRLYTYTIEETSITWPNGADVQASEIFEAPDVVENTYLVSNIYNSVKGALAVQKYLELPIKDGVPQAYPAIRFVLTRTYTKNDTTTSSPEIVSYQDWTSEQVRLAYEQALAQGQTQAGTQAAPLQHVLTFENLDVYAPNGSEYSYTVSEVKDYLGGYDTWAVRGDWAAADLAQVRKEENRGESVSALALTRNQENGRGATADRVAVTATFLNAPQTPDRQTVTLQGTKNWLDYNDVFQLRPDDVTLTLSRYANAQPGQGNPIAEAAVPTDAYRIQWTRDENANAWTYAVSGNVKNELERYAPNGMPWEYVVTETLPDGSAYKVAPASGRVGEKSQTDGVIQMNPLTNTLQTSIPYSKNWVDAEGALITTDYLGFDLTVTFQLQVAEQNGGTASGWTDAAGYFQRHLTDEAYAALFTGYAFEQSKTGRIDDASVWGKRFTFANLPNVIVKQGETATTALVYRVVETSVAYGQATQTIEVVQGADNTYAYTFGAGLFAPAYWANGRTEPWEQSQTTFNHSTTRDLYNRLQTTKFQVTKIWQGDNENLYGTRPDTGRTGYDWQTSFVIEATTTPGQADSWQAVQVYDADTKQDLVVTLYGTNDQQTVHQEITGLPSVDLNGAPYVYRARELQPDYSVVQGKVDDGAKVEQGQTYYDAYAVSYNAAYDTATNTLNPTKIYAYKQWNPSTTPKNISVEVQYKAADGTWKSFAVPAKVTLDGTADNAAAYYEYEPWKAVWSGLPAAMPGSDLTHNGKTQYRVVETLPNGYMQQSAVIGSKFDGVETVPEYGFTNVAATTLSVQKVWYGTTTGQTKAIVAGLWRTTAGEAGVDTAQAEAVLDAKGVQRTLTLSAQNQWKGTFTGLPLYDAAGNRYTYYAREQTIGGTPAEQAAFRIVHTDDFYHHNTTIANIALVDITGSKTWKDNANAYGTRPEQLELTLWRSIQNGREEAVNAVPVWTNTQSDVWTYQYTGLPSTDDTGNPYLYRVEETVPPEYACTQNGYRLTNTLTDRIEIPVTKVWKDGGNTDKLRPESITVVLYADGVEVRRATVTAGNPLQRAWDSLTGQSDVWHYTFTDLPEYDQTGKRIAYTIQEEGVPADYRTEIEGFTITNTLMTDLPVQKIWGGVPEADQKDVEVGLYARTAEDQRPQPVRNAQGQPMTLTLNAANGWKDAFKNLERFDADGARYLYSVQELSIDGKPAEEQGCLIHVNQDDTGAIISNIAVVQVSGVKTWKDNGNAYATRPQELALTLWRSVAGGQEEQVDATPVWTNTQTDAWTYTFAGLPMTDDAGNVYTYRVEETSPQGYVGAQQGNDFTNTLTGMVDIPIVKKWTDNGNAAGQRPEAVEVVLYANGEEVDRVKLTDDSTHLQKTWQAIAGTPDGQWAYTFTNLPEYDAEGKRIVYTVEEVNPPQGYEVRYDGFTIENVAFGSLCVTKHVAGSAAEKDRPFTFTVTLDDTSIQGDYGEMTFVNGVSTFTLTHGQACTASGLPADVGYTVTEAEADQDGYRTTSSGAEGTIAAADTATAAFVNHKDITPATGDGTHTRPYVYLFVISALGLGATLFVWARKRKADI